MKAPLGLPEGSIRAIIALLVVASGLVYWIVYQDIPVELLGIITAVIFFYFGSRTGEVVGIAREANSNVNGTKTDQ